MSKIPVLACAYQHTSDISDAQLDANKCTGFATICISRATTLLQNNQGSYGDVQGHTMSNLLTGMLATHRNIRKLLTEGSGDPGVVDAMALARLQLETLYVICLMVKGPQNVDWYLRDGWRKQYTQFLMKREECKGLPRFDEYIRVAPAFLENLRAFLGITPEQQLTIDHHELGVALPPGFLKQEIHPFPTPGKTIAKVTVADRKRMLERLYPEYVHLCSFSHGLAEANFFKGIFNKRLLQHALVSEARVQDTFQKEIASEAFVMSFLSMTQSAAELTALYPGDVELRVAAVNAWNSLCEGSLLGKVIWAIRARQLLGAMT